MAKFSYHTVEKVGRSDFRDRGSKFFGYAYPVESVEECKALLGRLKKEHPKASHFCLAWRLGPEGDLFRVSDDGEPSGSAGKPIEGQILSRDLTHVMVVVVRYFGGSLLGVPGLINAYKTAASDALDAAGRVEKNVEYSFRVTFDYTVMNDVMMAIRDNRARVKDQEQGLFCTYTIAVPLEYKDGILARLKEVRGVEF